MRIAYVAPYQGPGVLRSRPILLNLSLAGNVKIELISQLLRRNKQEVEILSQGEVVERRFKFYPAFCEPKPFCADIPVYYSSTFPVKFVNGLWSSWRTLELLKRRHRASPFDLVIIYNLKFTQVACANYAMRRLGLAVILEYEDDAFVDIDGRTERGVTSGLYSRLAERVLKSASGAVGASTHLLSRLSSSVPKLLLRGVLDDDIIDASKQTLTAKRNWVVYSGTHSRSKGLEQLIKAWGMMAQPDWELHITGHGELTDKLVKMALGSKSIVFHGLLNRQEYARFLSLAKIGMNPHDVSQTPGNVFAFKIIEYLAAGAHVITTPMGELEKEIEAGITYMADNEPATIASTLTTIIQTGKWKQSAAQYVRETYSPEAVSKSLETLLQQVAAR